MNKIIMIENDDILGQALNEKYALIFKNSTMCGISRAAKNEYEKIEKETIKLYMVNIIENRSLSKKIEESTGIKHQSPQVILMKNGKAVWNETHWKITKNEIEKAIKEYIE